MDITGGTQLLLGSLVAPMRDAVEASDDHHLRGWREGPRAGESDQGVRLLERRSGSLRESLLEAVSQWWDGL